jgi:hypothetical protein
MPPAEPTPPEPSPQTRRRQRVLGLLIWGGFAVIGVAALYGASILAGD